MERLSQRATTTTEVDAALLDGHDVSLDFAMVVSLDVYHSLLNSTKAPMAQMVTYVARLHVVGESPPCEHLGQEWVTRIARVAQGGKVEVRHDQKQDCGQLKEH